MRFIEEHADKVSEELKDKIRQDFKWFDEATQRLNEPLTGKRQVLND